MSIDKAAKERDIRKIGRDTSDTFGVRGAGASWQASFGMALNEADLLFAVRREPVANRIVFQVAHDVFDNWFRVEEMSEKPDANFDREVQRVLSILDAKAVFTQFAVYERLFGWAIIALSYADFGKGPEAPVSGPREIMELCPFSSLQFTVQSSEGNYWRRDKTFKDVSLSTQAATQAKAEGLLQKYKELTKEIAAETYSLFLKMQGKTWNPPRYQSARKLPFIPTEDEVNSLIAGCNKKTATFLQLLKETGMRCGEAAMLQWTDFDFENKTVNMTPEKGSEPRQLRISTQLIAMLNSLPKEKAKPFEGSHRHFARHFRSQRERIASKLKNDRIRKIHFHTLRHWKATMEYAKTKDILHVMQMLGHKNIQNTLLYTQLISFQSDEFYSATAKTVQDAQKLIEAGFEYVCDFNDVKVFRKRK